MTRGEMTPERELQALMQRLEAEVDETYSIPVTLTPQAAICLIGQLQLALRHPGNTGAAAHVGRKMIEGLLARLREGGFPAHAELAEMGNEVEPMCAHCGHCGAPIRNAEEAREHVCRFDAC
jgi:hypothetical protein